MDVDVKGNIGWLVAIGVTIIAWFTRRDLGRYDRGLDRIGALEATAVTKNELELMWGKHTAERESIRQENAAMHQENKEWLRRIEEKMDMFEDRRSKTEHAIRNMVGDVNLKVEVLAAKSGIKLPSSKTE